MAKGITLQELDSSAIVNLVPYLGTTSNSGDAYSITTIVPIDVNQKFTIKFNAASSTAPTLKINEGTSRPIKKANGNNAKLYASVYTLFWDGSAFILQGEGGGGNAQPGDVLAGKTFMNDNGEATGTMPNRGGMTLYASSNQDVAIPEGYHNGFGTVRKVTYPSPSNFSGELRIPGGSSAEIRPLSGKTIIGVGFYDTRYQANMGYAFVYGEAVLNPLFSGGVTFGNVTPNWVSLRSMNANETPVVYSGSCI
ncbi:hypothetical protein ACM1RC_33020 [Paenibacillus azoreducens]|uniref:hypothetical protein n=1 Tax=Paenibacillus azoreducens TaxID=116718 RepID=UPI0039F55D02